MCFWEGAFPEDDLHGIRSVPGQEVFVSVDSSAGHSGALGHGMAARRRAAAGWVRSHGCAGSGRQGSVTVNVVPVPDRVRCSHK